MKKAESNTEFSLELPRALFHMVASTTAISYFYLSDFLGAMILLVVGILFSTADFLRVQFGSIRRRIPSFMLAMVRPHEEDKISAITHFILAATLIDFLYLFCNLPKQAPLAATMFVAFGDPLARIVGVRFGRFKLFGTDKTLLGSTVFWLAGTVVGYGMGWLLGADLSIAILVLGGGFLMLTELFGGNWDNFTVPFFGTLVFWGLLMLGL